MTPIELRSFLRIDSSHQDALHLRPGQRVAAVVVRSDGENVVVRMMGRLVQMRTMETLEPGTKMTLQVEPPSRQGEWILRRIDTANLLQKPLFAKLDVASLLALATHDEQLKKRIKKELAPHTLATLVDTNAAKIGKILQKLVQEPKVAEALLGGVDERGFAKETILALLDHQRSLGQLRELKEELGQLYGVLQEGMQSFWLAALVGGLFVVSLPLDMESLEENSLAFKRFRECHFCRIYLRFRDIGSVAASLLFRPSHLEVYFAIEDDGFRQRVQDAKERLAAMFDKPLFIHITNYRPIDTASLLRERLQDLKI